MADTLRVACKRRRRTRLCIGGGGALLLLLLLAHPLWLPWVVRPVAARFGLHYDDHTRQGYNRLELTGLVWTNADVTLRADRLEVQMPHRWAWTRLTGAPPSSSQIRVENWDLQVSAPAPTSRSGEQSTAALLDRIQATAISAGRWLRSAAIVQGEVAFPGQRVSVPSVQLSNGVVTIEALETRAEIGLPTVQRGSFAIAAAHPEAAATLALRKDDRQWVFTGEGQWRSNRFQLQGEFDRSGQLPSTAVLASDAIRLGPDALGVDALGEWQGAARVVWSNGFYRFNLELAGQVNLGPASRAESATVHALGRGDLETVRIEELELESSPARAVLSRPLTLDYSGRVREGETTFEFRADLGRIQPPALSGELVGELSLRPTAASPFRGGFTLRGNRVRAWGVTSRALELAGTLEWPTLEVTTFNAQLESGGLVAADVKLQLDTKVLERAGWTVSASDEDLPPLGVQFETLEGRGSASGPWPNLVHEGQLDTSRLGIGMGRAETAGLAWSGRGLALDVIRLNLKREASALTLAGSATAERHPDGWSADAECHRLDWVSPDETLRLRAPFQVRASRSANGVDFRVADLDLAGPRARVTATVSIDGPRRGEGDLQVRELRADMFADFLAEDLPQVRLSNFLASARWDGGPLQLDSSFQVGWEAMDQSRLSLTGAVTAGEAAVRFDAVRLQIDGTTGVEMSGTLPLRVEPAEGWRVVETGSGSAARFDARIVRGGPVWELVEQRLGVRVESPSVRIEARGELPGLRGRLSVEAARLTLLDTNRASRFRVPALERPRLEATVGLGGVEILQASGRVLGQPVEGSAKWPIDAADWKTWIEAMREPDWTRVSGRLRLTNADLAELSALAPEVLAPMGRVDLELALQPGRQLHGHLLLTNAATRYLPPVGALREIEADITWDGWSGAVHRARATLGGRPVHLEGRLGWRPDGDRAFDLRLTGTNLSLVRDPELFVRADVDLRMNKAFDEGAALSGEITLQRSLLFRDFHSLVGLDRSRPSQRPPYFSIPQAPFGDWRLDVRLKGDRFLQVISPAFKGEVSAGLELSGTLREPVSVGTVTVDSGKILFPFGTLDVERGRAELSRADPYRPHLDFRGEGQNFGYTITVALTGPMDAPNLTFQSVPPLTAQQILLMLSAGEIPRSDFSYTGTDKAGRVGLYLGREVVNRFIGNTSTTERLSLRTGEYITDDGRPTYSLEYHIADRLSAFGEYDRFRDFNGGLKFKVLSR